MHGRLAMMAVAGVIVQEGFHPFAPDAAKPAIAQLTAPPSWEVGFLVAFVSFAELIRANRAFTDLNLDTDSSYERTIRTLKTSYEPGNLGSTRSSCCRRRCRRRRACARRSSTTAASP